MTNILLSVPLSTCLDVFLKVVKHFMYVCVWISLLLPLRLVAIFFLYRSVCKNSTTWVECAHVLPLSVRFCIYFSLGSAKLSVCISLHLYVPHKPLFVCCIWHRIGPALTLLSRLHLKPPFILLPLVSVLSFPFLDLSFFLCLMILFSVYLSPFSSVILSVVLFLSLSLYLPRW